MDTSYALAILWFFFACITFGCIVGGDEPKVWKQPTKGEAFKAWLIAIFWPIAFAWWAVVEFKSSWIIGVRK